MKKYKNALLTFSRILLGIVYIYSGFVKGADPMGTSIKIDEYLTSFSLDAINFISPLGAVILCGLELFVGLMLLFNLQKKIVSYITLALTSVFTVMTIYIYIASPVADCGCFGDAIKLTNGETLFKNFILEAMAIILFVSVTKSTKPTKSDNIFGLLLAIYAFAIPTYSTFTVPPLDFLPYSIGVNIPEAIHIPKNAPKDKYEIKLIYKNIQNGDIIEFSDTDTTWYDSKKWEFIDTKSKLIRKGFTPDISHFEITDNSSVSVYKELMSKNNLILLVVYNNDALKNISNSDIEQIRQLSMIEGLNVAVLTYDDADKVSKTLNKKHLLSLPVYNADNVQLKSMLRQKSGLIVLQNGTIIAKTAIFRDLELNSANDVDYIYEKEIQKRTVYYIILIALLTAIAATYTYLRIKKR